MNNRKYILIIILAGIAAYLTSFQNSFVWDDIGLISINPYIKSWKHIGDLFTSFLYHKTGEGGIFYRPIVSLSFLIDYSIWKENPVGYHLTNLLLHILNAILLYKIIFYMFKEEKMAFFTALLFLVHPIHTEAVTYISGRADPIVTLFMLFSLLLFITYAPQNKFWGMFYAITFYIFALLTKAYAIVFILLIGAYGLCFKPKIKSRHYLIFFVISLIYGLVRLALLKNETGVFLFKQNMNMPHLLLVISRSFAEYIRFLLFPINLHYQRELHMPHSIFQPIGILSILVPLAFILFVIIFRKKRPVLFGSIWFIVSLIPYQSALQLNATVAEHWLYFPSIGFFLVVSSLLTSHAKNIKYRHVLNIARYTFLVLMVIAGIVLTNSESRHWKNEITLYNYILKFRPNEPRVHNNLGNAYATEGRHENALLHFKKALKIAPGYSTAYFNMGAVYLEKKHFYTAATQFQKALTLNPSYTKARLYLADTYNRLGLAYYKQKNYPKARELWVKALKIYPGYSGAKKNLERLRR
ncbi:MAG: tetratricopeptide repeat protein [bacterium]|nr:tetratricopeptide repeat protein [bacterium]